MATDEHLEEMSEQGADLAQLRLLRQEITERDKRLSTAGREIAALRQKLDQALTDLTERLK
jgi:hypothetical protein